jgi:hypothetical protein
VEESAILDQDALAGAATLDQDDQATEAIPGQDALVGEATLDRDAAEPESEATLPAAKRSEAQWFLEVLANLDQDDQEHLATLGQVGREVSADRDQVVEAILEVVADLGQVSLEVAANLDQVCQGQREPQAHRCNTRFQYELMP